MSGWAAKQAKKAEWAEARKLDGLDNKETTVNDTRDAAMGKGEDQLFEKKLSKEEQLRQIYRNAYFSYMALNAEALED